ncbi:MAG: AI-2E family transporter [Gemmatimonadota bacterium]|nr:AI-2E family transporter [Gemmatimonadota bacterium]
MKGPQGADDASVLTPDVNESAQAAPIAPDAPEPDLGSTGRAIRSVGGRSMAVTVLAVLAVLYTLYFARAFLLPIVFALLLDFLFSPVVRALARWRIRPPIGAGLVVLALIGATAFAAYELTGPMQKWIAKAPATVETAQVKLRTLLTPLERVSRTAEEVQRATGRGKPEIEQVVVQGPSFASRVFGTTQRLFGGILQVIVLLYFLLAAGDLFLQKLIKVLPHFEDKRTAVQIARKTESSISTYLLTATAVNIGEGIVVAVAMYLLGMPNPALWGALVVVLEFIPYLGAIVTIGVLSLAALTTFDTVGHALLVPATFFIINLVHANFVIPLFLGRKLTLNPVAVFVGLAFWWWIWGIAGAFIAVPLLAALKIFCDHIESLAPFGEFLGQRDESERRTTIREPADDPSPEGPAARPSSA